MGFSRQEYQRGLPFPSPGDLPDRGIEPTSLSSPALAGGFFTTSATSGISPLNKAVPFLHVLISGPLIWNQRVDGMGQDFSISGRSTTNQCPRLQFYTPPQ